MSKILELSFFNKKAKNFIISQTFCFAPSKDVEAQLGSLYLLAEIKLPELEKAGFFSFLVNIKHKKETKQRGIKAAKFLEKIANLIQQEYYQNTKAKPFDALNSALQKTNVWLSAEKSAWQGLSFAVACLGQDLKLAASQIGNPKIIALNSEQVIDISVTLGQISLKFPALAEGKLEKNDLLMLFSFDLIKFLQDKNILNDILNADGLKAIQKIFKINRKILKQTTGCGLIVLAKKDLSPVLGKALNSLNPLVISEKNLVYQGFAKILPQSPHLPLVVKKLIISLIVLAILLPLGWLLFRK